MLKIKDDVDLKELEKFGFIEKRKYIRKDNIAVEKKSRELVIQAININQYGGFRAINNKNSSMININDEIYDLIKLDFVEKTGSLNESKRRIKCTSYNANS